MFGYIVAFLAGGATGAGLIIANHHSVQEAVKAERARANATIRKLTDENAQLRENSTAQGRVHSFQRGCEYGRFHPASDAEQFAKTFEGRRAQFKFAK